MRKDIWLDGYLPPETAPGAKPADVVASVRQHLARFWEAVHHDRPPARVDAQWAAFVIAGMLGDNPSAVAALRDLGMLDSNGRVVLKASGRKPGSILDSPDAWLCIAHEAAALVARGTSEPEAFRQVAKKHRGLTDARVRELYRGHYPIFQHDLEALPKRVTKAQVARESPYLPNAVVEQRYVTLKSEADQQRAIIVSRLEKLAALHWSCCKKG